MMTFSRHAVRLAATALLLNATLVATADATSAKRKASGKAAARSAAAKPDPQAVASAFATFCEEWMHKLAERQRDNIAHIKWEPVADGVEGSYVGYEQEHTCKLVEGTEADPVAKVSYREIHYVQRGGTVAEAQQATPKATEIFEVQEIFHYLKGKWDY
jgi:hypothetical protein